MLDRLFQYGKRAYKRNFETEDGRLVLLDVAKFVGADREDVYCSPDGRVFLAIDSGVFSASDAERHEALGRLRVYQRIRQMAGVDPDAITEAEQRLLERFGGARGDEE